VAATLRILKSTMETSSSDSGRWFLRQLRFTLFPATASENVTSWWSDVLGSEPETETAQRARAFRREEGAFHSGRLFLTSLPDRVDWVWLAQDKLEGEEILANLGEWPQPVTTFRVLMEKWLSISPPASRIALGVELTQPVSDKAIGYRRLQKYLPAVELDPIGSSEFLYRINRPRPSTSGIEGLSVNRLSTWTVVHTSLLSMNLPPTKMSQIAPVAPSQGLHCRAELDINTDQGFQHEFEAGEIRSLLNEFIEIAQEVAAKGDVK
jgi:hypothetical protein